MHADSVLFLQRRRHPAPPLQWSTSLPPSPAAARSSGATSAPPQTRRWVGRAACQAWPACLRKRPVCPASSPCIINHLAPCRKPYPWPFPPAPFLRMHAPSALPAVLPPVHAVAGHLAVALALCHAHHQPEYALVQLQPRGTGRRHGGTARRHDCTVGVWCACPEAALSPHLRYRSCDTAAIRAFVRRSSSSAAGVQLKRQISVSELQRSASQLTPGASLTAEPRALPPVAPTTGHRRSGSADSAQLTPGGGSGGAAATPAPAVRADSSNELLALLLEQQATQRDTGAVAAAGEGGAGGEPGSQALLHPGMEELEEEEEVRGPVLGCSCSLPWRAGALQPPCCLVHHLAAPPTGACLLRARPGTAVQPCGRPARAAAVHSGGGRPADQLRGRWGAGGLLLRGSAADRRGEVLVALSAQGGKVHGQARTAARHKPWLPPRRPVQGRLLLAARSGRLRGMHIPDTGVNVTALLMEEVRRARIWCAAAGGCICGQAAACRWPHVTLCRSSPPCVCLRHSASTGTLDSLVRPLLWLMLAKFSHASPSAACASLLRCLLTLLTPTWTQMLRCCG